MAEIYEVMEGAIRIDGLLLQYGSDELRNVHKVMKIQQPESQGKAKRQRL